MNAYAKLGQRIRQLDGWNDEVEVKSSGFSMEIDPLNHDMADYEKIAQDMPALAHAMLDFMTDEARGVLEAMNMRLEDNSLPQEEIPDNLDDIRDTIAHAFTKLDEIGEDNADYPDYEYFHVNVESEKAGDRIRLTCEFNDAEAIGTFDANAQPGKAIDSLFKVAMNLEDDDANTLKL